MHYKFRSKTAHLSQRGIVFWENHLFKLHVPFGPCYCAKLQKRKKSGSRVIQSHHFQAQNEPLAQNNVFLKKPLT